MLTQFLFTTSEAKVDYYYEQVAVRFASRAAERLNTKKILENFEKIPEIIRFDGEYPLGKAQGKILTVAQ